MKNLKEYTYEELEDMDTGDLIHVMITNYNKDLDADMLDYVGYQNDTYFNASMILCHRIPKGNR